MFSDWFQLNCPECPPGTSIVYMEHREQSALESPSDESDTSTATPQAEPHTGIGPTEPDDRNQDSVADDTSGPSEETALDITAGPTGPDDNGNTNPGPVTRTTCPPTQGGQPRPKRTRNKPDWYTPTTPPSKTGTPKAKPTPTPGTV